MTCAAGGAEAAAAAAVVCAWNVDALIAPFGCW